mmetsp:Transcript_80443/g.232385  ORF Transcript_80443/g.232385 Transcript_80443/m.232385 type:complete len:338 (-) Transcript_80443:146-1159(-)
MFSGVCGTTCKPPSTPSVASPSMRTYTCSRPSPPSIPAAPSQASKPYAWGCSCYNMSEGCSCRRPTGFSTSSSPFVACSSAAGPPAAKASRLSVRGAATRRSTFREAAVSCIVSGNVRAPSCISSWQRSIARSPSRIGRMYSTTLTQRLSARPRTRQSGTGSMARTPRPPRGGRQIYERFRSLPIAGHSRRGLQRHHPIRRRCFLLRPLLPASPPRLRQPRQRDLRERWPRDDHRHAVNSPPIATTLCRYAFRAIVTLAGWPRQPRPRGGASAREFAHQTGASDPRLIQSSTPIALHAPSPLLLGHASVGLHQFGWELERDSGCRGNSDVSNRGPRA